LLIAPNKITGNIMKIKYIISHSFKNHFC